MTDISELELELVARARGALEPAPEDRERLRVALVSKIAAMAALSGASSLPSTNAKTPRRLLNSSLASFSSAIAVTGAIAFVGGYWVGHHTRGVVIKTVTVVRPSAPAASASSALAPPEILASPSLASSFSGGHSGAHHRAAASATPAASLPPDSLSEELELLGRAERTIRNGNAQVALGLLAELDAKFPKGQLLEERTAARVMARCQLETEDSARARGNAYLLAHLQSVYAERIRSLCHLGSATSAKDSPEPGD